MLGSSAFEGANRKTLLVLSFSGFEPTWPFGALGVAKSESLLSDYFFVGEGRLPYCPSAPFARQVYASRPLLRMLSLRINPLLVRLSVWRRWLSFQQDWRAGRASQDFSPSQEVGLPHR